jgi:hypothetical protein
MSKSSLSQLTDPKSVAKAAQKTDSREHAMLCGALGAIAKGGKTVSNDESTTQKADHYWRVLNGQEKQKLGEKHFGEISELVKSFIIGPKKVKKVSSMSPSEMAKNLRRIASAIENSKSPSRELVLKDIKNVLASFISEGDGVPDEVVQETIEDTIKDFRDLESQFGGFPQIRSIIEQLEGRELEAIYKDRYPGWSKKQLQQLIDALKEAFSKYL